jgi:hypothetical protein
MVRYNGVLAKIIERARHLAFNKIPQDSSPFLIFDLVSCTAVGNLVSCWPPSFMKQHLEAK